MELYLYSGFSKMVDETKQPSLSNPTKIVDVKLKEQTSYNNPTFIISGEDIPAYNYAYLPAKSRFYFVKNITQQNRNMYHIECKTDPLATCKAQIGGYTCYIERCADSRYYNVDMPDNFLSVEDRIEHSATAVTPLFVSPNGCYVARIVGKDASGVATYVFNSLGEIGQIFNPVYAQYFQSGDWSGLHIGDFVQAFLCDPSKYLMGAYYSPLSSSDYNGYGVSETVNVGFYPTNIAGYRITTPLWRGGGSGAITLNKPASVYSDFRGSDPAFSQYVMYLPAVGTVNLAPEIMEGTLTLHYVIDLLTGDIFYRLFSSSTGLVATYTGNCYASLQISKGDASGGLNFLSNVVGGLTSAATGNVTGALKNNIDAVKNLITPTPSINGSQSGVAMLRDYPDVVISVLQKSSGAFPTAQAGRPCCKNLQIGNLTGYVKCGAPSLSLAIESEIQDEVNSYLANGFYYT